MKVVVAWFIPIFVVLFIIILDIFLIKDRFGSIFIETNFIIQIIFIFVISFYSFFRTYNTNPTVNYKSLILLKILLSIFVEFFIITLILNFYLLFFRVVVF